MKNLIFNNKEYELKEITFNSATLLCRCYENITYVSCPVSDIQKLSIYVAEAYYNGDHIHGYTLSTAPIFMPNTVGGYMPGPMAKLTDHTVMCALFHGYVVCCAGIRGREMKDSTGKYIGFAPAAIVDYKAAVRYLKWNSDNIPGDTEKIISNGTSAGGALSALLGASGDHEDYEPFLKKIGAANTSDSIFAASCYCPITNLENADTAYEWEFSDIYNYHRFCFNPEGISPVDGTLSEEQIHLSRQLAKNFPAYVASLDLYDETGAKLKADENKGGTLADFICKLVSKTIRRELEKGTDLSSYDWLNCKNKEAVSIDFAKLCAFRTRMKDAPAFDNIYPSTPENELFGNSDVQFRHFTSFSFNNSKTNAPLSETEQVKMMNPMNYIGNSATAKHFRIRHGLIDRDTSLSVSALLYAKLKSCGTDADIYYPWDTVHSGDYDLDELFLWVDDICKT